MYFVYILRCGDGSLYTGYTTNCERRVRVHQQGKGAKYTRSRLPVELVYVEAPADKPAALRREREIKHLTRAQKEQLVASSRRTTDRLIPSVTKKRQGGDVQVESEATKRVVQQQFGVRADAYVVSDTHSDPAALAALVKRLAPEPDWLALDVATGGGHVAKALAPHLRQVVASDLTGAMLEAARRHIQAAGVENVMYVIADAEQLPFLDNSFDVVTCRIAAHHFPDPNRFVVEAGRVLRPGGRLVIVDNVVPQDPDLAERWNAVEKLRDESHVRCPSTQEWRSWLQAAGFRVLEETERKKTFQFASWMGRMAKNGAHAAEVERSLMHSTEDFRRYFQVEMQAGRVQSFSGIEWLAVCVLEPAK